MSEKQLPIWVREKYLVAEIGLSRTILRGMREHALIISVSLQKDGCKQGALLYKLESLLRHIISTNDSHAKRFQERIKTSGLGNGDDKGKIKVLETETNISKKLGLTRSILRGLRFENPEFVVSFKLPGSKHGTLRYDVWRLIDYLDTLAAKQMEQTRKKLEEPMAKCEPPKVLGPHNAESSIHSHTPPNKTKALQDKARAKSLRRIPTKSNKGHAKA